MKAQNPLRSHLLDFLRDRDLRVLAISGPWGCGKTYWLRDFLNSEDRWFDHYKLRPAYISLFGVVSTSEMKRKAVIAARTPRSSPADPAWDWLCYWTTWLLTRTRANLPRSVWGFSASALGEMVEEFAFSAGMKGLLLCVDDLERRSPHLRLKDILGVIEEFAEQRECKVIVVLNTDGLGSQQSEFRTLEEKVIDHTVVYRPTPTSLAPLVFCEDLTHVTPVLEKLGVSNVRIMRRIRTVIREVEKITPVQLFASIRGLISAQTARYISFHLAYPELFEISKLHQENRYARMFRKTEEESPDEKRRSELLNAVDFLPAEFDVHLVRLIKGEQPDKDAMLRSFKELSEKLESAAAEEEFSRVWDLYHDNFAVSASAFVKAMIEFLERKGDRLKPANVIIGCEVCLTLPHDASNNARIREILRVPISAMAPEKRVSLQQKYPNAIELANQSGFPYKPSSPSRDLSQVFEAATKNDGWDPNDIRTLSLFSENEIFDLLSNYQGERLLSRLDDLLKLRIQSLGTDNPDKVELLRKFKHALAKLAAADALHESKIQRHLGDEFLPNRHKPEGP